MKQKNLEENLNEESNVCKHFEYCNVAKISGRNCADYQTCQTYKFYERYGKNWDEMFVGSLR